MDKDTVVAYVAHAITGRTGTALNAESRATEVALTHYNIVGLDPVLLEKIPDTDEIIPNRPDDGGQVIWGGDEAAIRRSHVLLDITPELKSEGVMWETGYARFFLWKPVVRVYKPGSSPHMAMVFKGDAITFSLEEAAKVIHERWGTRRKRIIWRLKMLFRSLPKFFLYQLGEFK